MRAGLTVIYLVGVLLALGGTPSAEPAAEPGATDMADNRPVGNYTMSRK